MRRPCKNILIYTEDCERASILAFVLNQQPGIVVHQAESGVAFSCAIHAAEWDLITIPCTGDAEATATLTNIAKRQSPQCNVLVIDWSEDGLDCGDMWADHTMRHNSTNAEIINAVRNLTARKNGPRPDFRWQAVNGKSKMSRDFCTMERVA